MTRSGRFFFFFLLHILLFSAVDGGFAQTRLQRLIVTLAPPWRGVPFRYKAAYVDCRLLLTPVPRVKGLREGGGGLEMMNGELPSLGDVNPKATLKGVQLSQSYNPLTHNAHTSSHPSDGLWLFVTRPTKRAAYSCDPPRARQFPMKVRRGICWHIALSLRSSVTLGNNGPLQIHLIDGAFVLGSLADQRRRVWPEWQEKKRLRVFKSFLSPTAHPLFSVVANPYSY